MSHPERTTGSESEPERSIYRTIEGLKQAADGELIAHVIISDTGGSTWFTFTEHGKDLHPSLASLRGYVGPMEPDVAAAFAHWMEESYGKSQETGS